MADQVDYGPEEESYPGQLNDMRRHRIVENAVDAADQIILEGSSGDVEETDWLTAEVALRFMQKVHGRLQSQLLKLDLTRR